jgi:predicted signal transduction protein with EAL and GGDEF domain
LTSACGFALFPLSAVEPSELVRLADAALYRAKAVGPGSAAVFDPRTGRSAACGTAFDGAFRRAPESSAIASRPFIALAPGRIRNLEQAARLNDPSLMPIASPAFVPLPERIRVI